MSNHYLVVDDARKVYFDCGKLLPLGYEGVDGYVGDALSEQPWEQWLRLVNWGDEPPAKTDRHRLALPEARALFDFLVASGWTARIVSLDSDDWDDIYEPWAKEEGRPSYRCAGGVPSADGLSAQR